MLVDHPKFGPRGSGGDTKCPACNVDFKEGDYTTLVALGPGSSPEEQERCRDNRPYNAVAAEIHWACATGRVD